MANLEHVARIRQDKKAWNAWRQVYRESNIDLSNANLSGISLDNFNLSGVNLSGADLGGSTLNEANLSKANLSRAWLGKAQLRAANLRGANLSWASLDGTVLINSFLSNALLNNAHINKTNMSTAVLNKADLRKTYITETNLSKVHLMEANLTGTVFNKSDMSDAILRSASLIQSHLSEMILKMTDFEGAILGATTLLNTDLSQTIGLEKAQHLGPSTISIDTLMHSKGNIPEIFLRRCGVPDSWIEYLPSLVGTLQPIQYHSCFISYASQDEDFTNRLYGRMQQEQLRTWFAPHDLKGGHKLREQIDQAIQLNDKLLLILSISSIDSTWVAHEIRRAYQKGIEQQRRVLFPIGLTPFEALKHWELPDDDTGLDLATEVRRYYIPDFTNWKDHDAFETAFAQLLAALRAQTSNLKQQ